MSVPSVGIPLAATVSVYGPAPDPVTPVTVHPLEVPPSEMSDAVRPVTGSPNVREYVAGVVPIVDNAGVNDATDGGPRSTVTVAAVLATTGPNAPPTSMTVPVGSERITVPVVPPPTVTVYGPAPEPVTDCTVQPVAVPPTVKSLASRPVTARVKRTL